MINSRISAKRAQKRQPPVEPPPPDRKRAPPDIREPDPDKPLSDPPDPAHPPRPIKEPPRKSGRGLAHPESRNTPARYGRRMERNFEFAGLRHPRSFL